MKKEFKIKLYSGAPALAGELAILSAKSNGGDIITLPELKGIFEAQKRLYPVSYEGAKCEIIGDSLLHLDCPVSGQELNKTVLVIEEVEVFELEK